MMGMCSSLCVTANPLESLHVFFSCLQCILQRIACERDVARSKLGQTRKKHGFAARARVARWAGRRPDNFPKLTGIRLAAWQVQAQTGEESMAIRSFQRSIRFTKNEWDAVVEAAEKAGMAPGSFVRKAAARAAADDLYLYGGGLTPKLAELIKRTFRGVHLLAYLKHEELGAAGAVEDFRKAADAAQDAQDDTLGPPDSSDNSR